MSTTFKLSPKEARQKLVEALRSGEYEQAYGRLKDDEGYCCLGVACDIYRRLEKPDECKWDHEDSSHVFYTTEKGIEEGELPDDVSDWLGFSDNIGTLSLDAEERDTYVSLIDLNDSEEYTFNDIAKVIETDQVQLKQ